MKYVIGIDLGTSSVKVLLLEQTGEVCGEVSRQYPLIQEQPGYSEQDPEEWITQTILALKELLATSQVHPMDIEGLSYSGQMHGLVLLDHNHKILRKAILWNDTRTTKQCRDIEDKLGELLFQITKNPALEGFTLPKILWVKKNEPHLFGKAKVFLLPKDYLRYRMTGQIQMEYSDAAGTLLLDVINKEWSTTICNLFQIDTKLCPPLVESSDFAGYLLPEIIEKTGLSSKTKVFAGGADNACGAVGAGIISPGMSMCSIGTSGVVLSYEEEEKRYPGNLHFFNHSKKDSFYAMGVTLAAGYSLSWFKDTFAENESFDTLLNHLNYVPIGSNGLLFTPYLVGERTPHADSMIRGSFIGIDSSHTIADFIRAVVEGITFSLNESIELFKQADKKMNTIVAIGGGARNETWLQIQADVFNTPVVRLKNEQGPAMGAAMLAASGCGWFPSLEQCAQSFIKHDKVFTPITENVEKYSRLFKVYQKIYYQTKSIHEELKLI